jgi:hypothetical protein
VETPDWDAILREAGAAADLAEVEEAAKRFAESFYVLARRRPEHAEALDRLAAFCDIDRPPPAAADAAMLKLLGIATLFVLTPLLNEGADPPLPTSPAVGIVGLPLWLAYELGHQQGAATP